MAPCSMRLTCSWLAGFEVVANMAYASFFDIAVEIVAIGGVGAILDNCFGALHGPKTAKVGEALFGHHDLHRMLIVVDVGAHGHDRRDLTPFAMDGHM